MRIRSIYLALAALLLSASVLADGTGTDTRRDILITFDNGGARSSSVGAGAPYKHRKRYSLSAEARQHSRAIAAQYSLAEIDHWPIRSLSVYCFVYRIAEGNDRDSVIASLRADARVESVQALHEFETGTSNYDDTYANLQHGLDALDILDAHRYSRGSGVRVAIIDSNVDTEHEDLQGRVGRVLEFADRSRTPDIQHGTAVASLIVASANNARGIVGVAPEAELDVFVSCWAEAGSEGAVCDSFTLAKALDTLLGDPPQVLNLSLKGPSDPLVARLLLEAHRAGVIIVAASSSDQNSARNFPASLRQVIGVGSSAPDHDFGSVAEQDRLDEPVYAPGNDILVAIPNDAYDFRSGSSLAAAQVSGVIALLLAVDPELRSDAVRSLLYESQFAGTPALTSINACAVLRLADGSRSCRNQLASTDP